MTDNTILNPGSGGDTIRDLARGAGTIKTQVIALDLGGASANAEVLMTAGQQAMAASMPVAMALDQPAMKTSGSSDVEYAGKPNGLITASGNTTVYTPATGKSARIHWISVLNRPVDSTCPLITVSAGATQLYSAWGVQRAQVDTGPANGAVVINLSVPGNVAYNFRIEDV